MNDFMFRMPTKVMFGVGALRKVPGLCREQGYSRIFVVTGSTSTSKSPQLQELLAELADLSIATQVFSEVEADPSIETVDRGAAALGAFGADAVIAFGGGSPMDAAKSMSLVSANGGSIADYMRAKKAFVQRGVPLICVPTTAGTGSEVTASAVTTDKATKEKIGIGHDFQMPAYAVIDPLVQVSMPPAVTAATGMDALTHAIEAYVSTAATPITDACALQAITLVGRHLRQAVQHGDDLIAREQMAYAQFLAGMAFNNASLGYVHAMAHQLGGFYDLPHGVCNAILLPHVQAFNARVAGRRLADVGQALGVDVRGLDAQAGADCALQAIRELARDVGIPSGTGELGAREADIPTLAANAMKDACGATNPVQPTFEEVCEIYRAAL